MNTHINIAVNHAESTNRKQADNSRSIAVFEKGVKRVVTTITIDDRRDVERSMEDKVKSLKRLVKKA